MIHRLDGRTKSIVEAKKRPGAAGRGHLQLRGTERKKERKRDDRKKDQSRGSASPGCVARAHGPKKPRATYRPMGHRMTNM